MSFDFAAPWALLLLAVPLLASIWTAWRGRSLRPVLRMPSLAGLASAPRGWRVRLRPLVTVGRILALALVVVAIARPRLGQSYETVTAEGIDIVLALDTSGSMLAEDMAGAGGRINRLQAAKEVAADFVRKREADRIGLLSFDESAVPRCPPTLDYGVLLDLLGQVEIDGEGGKTAIGTALASALNRLRESEAMSRIVILVTDGRNNAGRVEPIDAAEMARTLGVRVYTIGIGTRGEAPYPVRGPFGMRSYQRIRSDIDEETLKDIADKTGGEYFRATHRGELDRIFELVDELERTEIEVNEHVRHRELFPELVRAAAGLLALALLGGATLWRTVP